MPKLTVRHQRLPRIGELSELDTASGLTLVVVTHRSGWRDIAIAARDEEQPAVTAGLSRAAHIELATTPSP